MKTAIYQYWYGSKPKESANAGRKNMEAYANKIGADYIFETDPKFYGGPCSLEKKYSALRPIYDDMFLKYDKVMYVDLDVFVTDKCTENIFEEENKFLIKIGNRTAVKTLKRMDDESKGKENAVKKLGI